eukprot:TRINITY_DN5799_c0_g1_i7.p1 TRINITY_DN5799_c0_g1~~TRINITY_DN5799_c0_g1_i7.p1  ORF type:complete len:201 (+),score=5.71 TRINITY_DN5799_c0_g1_i7:293-895(+)
MNVDKLSYKAYRMLLELDNRGKQCWVSKIREMLCLTGFNIVWLQQGVGDVKLFLREFKQRLIDFFFQEWTGTIRDHDRFESYRTFKTLFEKERYVLDMDIYCFRVAITQTRFNVLPLNNNMYRYSDVEQEKACPFCKYQNENEYHFLFKCAVYDDLRKTFLKDSARLPIHLLLNAKNNTHRYNLSRFVFHAINRRKRIIA